MKNMERDGIAPMFIELGPDELTSIDAGGPLSDLGKFIGHGVGYALGAVKDFATSGSWPANEALMLAL